MGVIFPRHQTRVHNADASSKPSTSGGFVNHAGERFYAIKHVDQMPHFFMSVVSHSDHWLFVSSNGGVTAGRVSPETALFPYVAVDQVQDGIAHTGCKTLFRVHYQGRVSAWEPFNYEHDDRYRLQRNLYKNTLGNKLCFEEINHDLQLVFRYTWMSSEHYGFVRACELLNVSDEAVSVDLLDGFQNVLPASAPRSVQTTASNLVDAYKWTELDEQNGVALFTLYSGITDKPEPCESLRANTVFCRGLEPSTVLLSSRQLNDFRSGKVLQQETHTRGVRGAYLVNTTLQLAGGLSKRWQLVANLEQSQRQVTDLCHWLSHANDVEQVIQTSVDDGSDALRQIMAAMDGLQLTDEENVSVHHYANVLFNGMRGGIFDDQYRISTEDFSATVKHFNASVYQAHTAFLAQLPETIEVAALLTQVKQQGDVQLERLCYEYLPLTFGRRHGDPSRPWNQFAIKLQDSQGKRLLSYQGNWRDIFQNWEALLFSYPTFTENVIAKFVNASTVDGYNPYRVTKEGIDWEVEDPEDPWSYIGYWGDHQIIYLLKLLELSQNFHPGQLQDLLHQPLFCYANVPYRIKPFADLLNNPKDTVEFDHALAKTIEQRVAALGADGKLLLNADGAVYLVNLLEKLLVPLLSKLSNFVMGGGIWLNTQRPEWNDANNALVGQGLSMVTMYYLRRYVSFLQQLIADEMNSEAHHEAGTVVLSEEVSVWLNDTVSALTFGVQLQAQDTGVSNEQRFELLQRLGLAGSHYRQAVYQNAMFSGRTSQPLPVVQTLLDTALQLIDHSIAENRRTDGIYHAYNLLEVNSNAVAVDRLYPMLEGQVAVLSSGAVTPAEAVDVLNALFESACYRADQQTFMLYPDRALSGFLEKNQVSAEHLAAIPSLQPLLEAGDQSILVRDAQGVHRFHADLINRAALDTRIDAWLGDNNVHAVGGLREALHALYEATFNHKAFTGRSGGMFGFEGLGCIYWHMVSKLLLATQEMFFREYEATAGSPVSGQLAQLYYRVREGIGFNKSPEEYGAFPTDPYSHTPKHAGAQQPGMTGQVKEEVLTRFGELGIRVQAGAVHFRTALLREREFINDEQSFRYLDVADTWQTLAVPAHALAFTWCQVPIVYVLDDSQPSFLRIEWRDDIAQRLDEPMLPASIAGELFARTGTIRQLTLTLNTEQLCTDTLKRL